MIELCALSTAPRIFDLSNLDSLSHLQLGVYLLQKRFRSQNWEEDVRAIYTMNF